MSTALGPPPSYSTTVPSQPSHASSSSLLESLPTHLLLSILSLVPLPTLIFGVKPTSRTLYLLVCSLAREWALPLWEDEVRRAAASRGQALSTDPLGVGGLAGGSTGDVLPLYDSHSARTAVDRLPTRSRELAVLDSFVVALARSSALLEASSLFSASNDSSALSAVWAGGAGGGESSSPRSDLFGLMQPRARMEDLVIAEGGRRGLIEVEGVQGGQLVEETRAIGGGKPATVRAEDVRVELKPRQATLLLPFRSASGRVIWKAAVELPRRAEDSLETVTGHLVGELRWLKLCRVDRISHHHFPSPSYSPYSPSRPSSALSFPTPLYLSPPPPPLNTPFEMATAAAPVNPVPQPALGTNQCPTCHAVFQDDQSLARHSKSSHNPSAATKMWRKVYASKVIQTVRKPFVKSA
ncbi:hypothetical protein JCM8547_003633 [Rhodosporidiobolus lusitaniae]